MTTIEAVMSPNIHSIGIDLSIHAAEEQMRKYGIRHLPVLSGGQLVGILSDRDIKLMRKFPAYQHIAVEDAMSADPYVVDRLSSVSEVATVMAERKLGSVVVTEEGKPVGIFTAVDGMKLLAALCGAKS